MNGFALARYVAERWPQIEDRHRVWSRLPCGRGHAGKATFIAKPFNQRMIHEHLNTILPDEKKPEPLKKAV